MEKTYASKKDGWLVAVMGMFFVAVNIWKAPVPAAFKMLIPILLLLLAAFMLWTLYGTNYTLTNCELIIRSGPLRWTVRLDSITEVFPTHNPLSSPACSLDRLQVRYRNSVFGIMISPEDKAGFLRDLAARVPGLKFENERAVRV